MNSDNMNRILVRGINIRSSSIRPVIIKNPTPKLNELFDAHVDR